MSDQNTVAVIGRLTRDAESKQVGDKTVVIFSIASNYYSKQNPPAAVNYFEIESWHVSGIVRHLVKGKQVGISGEMRQERWETDGQKRSKIKILAHHVQLLGSADREPGQAQAESAEFSDDMPF
jgi:single-strand DNA-binding protein